MLRKRPYISGFLILLSASLFINLLPFARSLIITPIYSYMQYKGSIPAREHIEVRIPGGLQTGKQDWFPFVLNFQPGTHFSWYSGRNADLTIYYNFPAFDFAKGASMLYDPASDYYNSFYGAYFVQTDDRPFGFTEQGECMPREAVLVPEYDFEYLVLGSFDSFYEQDHDRIFDWTITAREDAVSYLGYDGWTMLDADMTINGCAHQADRFQVSYLQYGSPSYDGEESFAAVPMKGRIYMRYFPEWNSSVFFYIIATKDEIIKDCDQNILSKSKLIAY